MTGRKGSWSIARSPGRSRTEKVSGSAVCVFTRNFRKENRGPLGKKKKLRKKREDTAETRAVLAGDATRVREGGKGNGDGLDARLTLTEGEP